MNTCYTDEDDPDDDDNVHKLSSLSCHKKIQQKIKTDLCVYNFFSCCFSKHVNLVDDTT